MATATKASTNKPAAKPADSKPSDQAAPAKPVDQAPAAVPAKAAAPSFTVDDAGTGLAKIQRESKPNPLKGQVRASLTKETASIIRNLSEDELKLATHYLRKDSEEEKLGLRTQVNDLDNGRFDLLFQGSEKRRGRKYSNDDIRKWAQENNLPVTGGGKAGGQIPASTREMFKQAHGYAKDGAKAEEKAAAK